jgi:hypothetical protein
VVPFAWKGCSLTVFYHFALIIDDIKQQWALAFLKKNIPFSKGDANAPAYT